MILVIHHTYLCSTYTALYYLTSYFPCPYNLEIGEWTCAMSKTAWTFAKHLKQVQSSSISPRLGLFHGFTIHRCWPDPLPLQWVASSRWLDVAVNDWTNSNGQNHRFRYTIYILDVFFSRWWVMFQISLGSLPALPQLWWSWHSFPRRTHLFQLWASELCSRMKHLKGCFQDIFWA